MSAVLDSLPLLADQPKRAADNQPRCPSTPTDEASSGSTSSPVTGSPPESSRLAEAESEADAVDHDDLVESLHIEYNQQLADQRAGFEARFTAYQQAYHAETAIQHCELLQSQVTEMRQQLIVQELYLACQRVELAHYKALYSAEEEEEQTFITETDAENRESASGSLSQSAMLSVAPSGQTTPVMQPTMRRSLLHSAQLSSSSRLSTPALGRTTLPTSVLSPARSQSVIESRPQSQQQRLAARVDTMQSEIQELHIQLTESQRVLTMTESLLSQTEESLQESRTECYNQSLTIQKLQSQVALLQSDFISEKRELLAQLDIKSDVCSRQEEALSRITRENQSLMEQAQRLQQSGDRAISVKSQHQSVPHSQQRTESSHNHGGPNQHCNDSSHSNSSHHLHPSNVRPSYGPSPFNQSQQLCASHLAIPPIDVRTSTHHFISTALTPHEYSSSALKVHHTLHAPLDPSRLVSTTGAVFNTEWLGMSNEWKHFIQSPSQPAPVASQPLPKKKVNESQLARASVYQPEQKEQSSELLPDIHAHDHTTHNEPTVSSTQPKNQIDVNFLSDNASTSRAPSSSFPAVITSLRPLSKQPALHFSDVILPMTADSEGRRSRDDRPSSSIKFSSFANMPPPGSASRPVRSPPELTSKSLHPTLAIAMDEEAKDATSELSHRQNDSGEGAVSLSGAENGVDVESSSGWNHPTEDEDRLVLVSR